ncbi:MAG TPA: helix-hairpin-helix domain-containing protein [Pyrinomonadaceae bacterium]|nr:helix-hairpin-helix domain-containing protein [Pyrinomonadaceae bacterium]
MNANKKTIFAKSIPVLFMTVVGLACSSRIEYGRPIAQAPASTININTATVDDLERLPHIGRKTAEAIVEFRTANGPFRRVEHLMLIRGVSEPRFAELRPILRAD